MSVGSSVEGLDGSLALVTGAGRGIGRATALALARAGADVVLASRTEADLREVAAEVEALGVGATVAPCDLTVPGALDATLDALPRPVDVLVNGAGTNRPGPFVDVLVEDLDLLLAQNVRAPVLVAQAVVQRLLAAGRPGAIVNLSSQMGHVGYPGRSVYCTTKHAIEGLTKALAVELAPHGIRVNSVAPTFLETAMTAAMFEDETFRAEVLGRIPLGRLGTVDEVAAAIVFLASPAASLITGASLRADGGWTAV
ncbi:MAG TPA: SDR family oxidoreductase [Conexibacter sp.]|nr:SDR family oxidoreductase [Conexibacter sp.]